MLDYALYNDWLRTIGDSHTPPNVIDTVAKVQWLAQKGYEDLCRVQKVYDRSMQAKVDKTR